MSLNSSLFDRVRIRPETAEAVAENEASRCAYPGCGLQATHRAPKGRQQEGQYYRFCLTHVQEYNKGYNYFAGMKEADVSAYQKDAITGHRPTWTLGVNRRRDGNLADADMQDPFGMFDQARRTASKPQEPAKPRLGRIAAKALETLGLDDSADRDAIRARYKLLVKRLHPDANGGDRSREDKLREIINAYNTLKSAGLA